MSDGFAIVVIKAKRTGPHESEIGLRKKLDGN